MRSDSPSDISTSAQFHQKFWKHRVMAFAIDLLPTLVASWVGERLVPLWGEWFYLVMWFGLRIGFVSTHHGMSPGRYFLRIKVIHQKTRRTPVIFTLLQREGMIGIASMMVWLGLQGLWQGQWFSTLMFLPALADLGWMGLRPHKRHPFHDDWSKTRIVPTRRGFQINSWHPTKKISDLLDQRQKNMQQ